MPLTLLSLLDSSQPIFYIGIFDCLDVVDTMNLLATCHQIRALKRQIYSVNALLRPFFKDPVQFRQIMADNDLIVGGSMALRLFSREEWASNDIDVYTESHDAVPIVAAFLEKKGYRYQPYFWQSDSLSETLSRRDRVRPDGGRPPLPTLNPLVTDAYHYGLEQIKDIYMFVQKGTNKKIEVVLTRGSVLQLIMSYYATFLMNFFTYRTAFSLFPWSTFCDKTGYYVPPQTGLGEKTLRGVRKYQDRGYFIETVWQDSFLFKNCLRLRAVGDCYSWSMPLCTDGIVRPSKEARLQGQRFSITFKGARSFASLETRRAISLTQKLEDNLKGADHLTLKLDKSPRIV
ncbi:hypothetical protein TWF506_004463 [Arthrobotrys conoides]|uniref:Uncharacterized protein n=1 Tax=Arthrobotrys conoides TaxID=74498 RepID=A0AAN8N350_9PEZI